jgi:hypothetical protein
MAIANQSSHTSLRLAVLILYYCSVGLTTTECFTENQFGNPGITTTRLNFLLELQRNAKIQKRCSLTRDFSLSMMNKKPNPYSLGSHMTPIRHISTQLGGSRVCIMGKGQILYCVYYFIYTLAFCNSRTTHLHKMR